jgi:hypothetical protein
MTAIRANMVGPELLDYYHQRFDRGLPLGESGFLFRQGSDVVGSVSQADKVSPIGQRYRILELALPAHVGHPMRSNLAC